MGWEDEPRDAKGEWTTGGSGGPQQHARASVDAHAINEQMKEATAKDVKGNWGTSPKANVAEAERVARAQGYETSVYRKAPSKEGGRNIAMYSQGKIHFNASSPYWKDPVAKAEYMHSVNHLSSGDPEHLINHEIGHAIYDPPDNFMNHMHERALIEKHVSKYAAHNPKEFVSEVHAGIKGGKQYNEHIMRMFHNYARPRTSR